MNRSKKVKSEVRQVVALLSERSFADETLAMGPSTSNACGNVSFEEFRSEGNSSESESESEKEEIVENLGELRDELASWAVQFNITNAAANSLLKILSTHICGLPKDVRTLKSTPKSAPVEKMGLGEYVHYGVKDTLTDFLLKNSSFSGELSLNINIDGLPLAKSSNLQTWPILINVNGTPDVMVVGAYCGKSKPLCPNTYLTRFVNDLCELIDVGLIFEEKLFPVNCRAFICDAPARSHILGIKGHTGFFSCLKCTQKGESVNHRMIFRSAVHNFRTDSNFRLRIDANHHKLLEPLAIEKLPIDIVNSFPNDYMHVVCLGVMKTLLIGWIRKRNCIFSLKPSEIKLLNSKLLFLSNQVPKEFARHPRSLNEIERFKATELRSFLLYTGIFVLADVLDAERYNHFLLLSLGVRILLDEKSCMENNECAKVLLSEFVKNVSRLYDDTFLTFNFHCLTHLANDAFNYGCLESISAFKFENYLSKLKRKCKKNHQIAVQIYNRLVEDSLRLPKPPNDNKNKKVLNNGTIKSIYTNLFYFSTKRPDNFYSINNRIFKVMSISQNESDIEIIGKEVLNLKDFFTIPIKSSNFNIKFCDTLQFSNSQYQHLVELISQKIIMFSNFESNQFLFIPFIHM